MKLKFCANLSFMFQETPSLLDRYSQAKLAGFRAVECAFPYDYTVKDVVNAKNVANVEQILINVFVGDVSKGELGFAAVPGQQGNFLESINLAIKYAKGLQCKKIHIMSGIQQVNEVTMKLYEENIRYATTLFEKEDIMGLIEPINPYAVPEYFMNSYERGHDLIKSINSPNLKLMMDLFHLQHLKGNLTNNIIELLPIVGHIQVAQVPNRNEPDTSGEIDYHYIFSLLEKHGYSGWIGLEYKPKTTTQEGLKWIRDFGIQL